MPSIDFLIAIRRLLTFIGGYCLATWAGLPSVSQLLIAIMLCDFAIGFTRALLDKRLSLKKSWRSNTKKVLVLVLLYMVDRFERHFGGGGRLTEYASCFYVFHFFLSVLTNLTLMGVPVPPYLREQLLRMDLHNKEKAGEPADSTPEEGNAKQ